MDEIWLIRSTFAKKDEAISVARELLEQKLIACANIEEGMTALFRWEDMIQQEPETVLLAKTVRRHAPQVIAHIKTLHSYQIPSILAWPAGAVEPSFAAWVAAEVS
ncbi:MAG: divalent-cation tolerance protein CutA [Alphaproteobacteria bacterium]|nr:divalent-cation tolerance protein CutA [Alphaproteobacteria bacterium]